MGGEAGAAIGDRVGAVEPGADRRPAESPLGAEPTRREVAVADAVEHVGRSDPQDRGDTVEALGYDELYSYDHIGSPASPAATKLVDPFVPLVIAAHATRRLRVGPLVLNNEFHQPALLARTAATVHRMTDGRLVLGLGTGYAEQEQSLIPRASPRWSTPSPHGDGGGSASQRAEQFDDGRRVGESVAGRRIAGADTDRHVGITHDGEGFFVGDVVAEIHDG